MEDSLSLRTAPLIIIVLLLYYYFQKIKQVKLILLLFFTVPVCNANLDKVCTLKVVLSDLPLALYA